MVFTLPGLFVASYFKQLDPIDEQPKRKNYYFDSILVVSFFLQDIILFLMFAGNLQKKGNESLCQSVKVRLSRAISALECEMKAIISATISLHDFDILSDYSVQALSLCQYSDTLMGMTDDLKLAFQKRNEELHSFQQFMTDLSQFWQICKPSFKGLVMKIELTIIHL